ncbi:hypothetical protein GCM10010099_22500 [Streptomyces cinereus]|nr:hypothetical protein GCM10010099_22500 [Streptomyces cinereus]
MTAPSRPRPIADLDVSLAELVRQIVVASLDPFARMACEHPDACSCDDDYPNWTPGGAA